MKPATQGRARPFRRRAALLAAAGLDQFRRACGQVAIMHDELVERRRRIGERACLRGLDFCMLLPGLEARQLARWSAGCPRHRC